MKKLEFTKEISIMLKGLLAIGIVIHHLALKTNIIFIKDILKYLGFPIVATFFFISGYGLLSSISKNKEKYLQIFLIKRFISILIPFFLSIIIFQICLYFDTNIFNLGITFNKLLQGNTNDLLPFSWYIFEIIYFYLLFYFVMKYSKRNMLENIFIIVLLSILLIYALKIIHFGDWWHISSLAFSLGLFIKYFENCIIKKLNLSSNFFILIVLCIFLLIPIFGINHYASALLFPLFVYLIIINVNIPKNKILLFLGKISYEIYLIQGISIIFLRGNFISITNDYLYCIVTLIITIPLALFINKISALIIKKLI